LPRSGTKIVTRAYQRQHPPLGWIGPNRASGAVEREPIGFATEGKMNFILWLIIGGIIGWLASIVMRTDAQQGIILNVVVGIVGAFIGGLILTGGSINSAPLTLYSFLVSLLGAIILLAIVNLVRRGSIR
jgi:uncharacterized membrane protein YeaQ/YmgE (transglycosylase-associated protein family)